MLWEHAAQDTEMIVSFWIDSLGILQTQIRLLLKEQSDLAPHCLLFCLHLLDTLLYDINGKNHIVQTFGYKQQFPGVRILMIFSALAYTAIKHVKIYYNAKLKKEWVSLMFIIYNNIYRMNFVFCGIYHVTCGEWLTDWTTEWLNMFVSEWFFRVNTDIPCKIYNL